MGDHYSGKRYFVHTEYQDDDMDTVVGGTSVGSVQEALEKIRISKGASESLKLLNSVIIDSKTNIAQAVEGIISEKIRLGLDHNLPGWTEGEIER